MATSTAAAHFSLWSPKAGLLWDVDPTWQVFGNISRSAEVPSFGESVSPNFLNPNYPTIPFFLIRPQIATTYEIGTRGKRPDFTWELIAYRANIRDELQCQYSSFGNCNVTNLDRTIHQGIEAGVGAAVFRNIFVTGNAPDKIWLNLAYTFNDFRFDDDPTFGNNQLPGAPRHYLRGAEALYKHPSGFYVPNLEWVPQSYFVDSANTLKTEPYAIWGLRRASTMAVPTRSMPRRETSPTRPTSPPPASSTAPTRRCRCSSPAPAVRSTRGSRPAGKIDPGPARRGPGRVFYALAVSSTRESRSLLDLVLTRSRKKEEEET